jgi:hypothetical protein
MNNRPFANLDRLKDRVTPSVTLPRSVNQGSITINSPRQVNQGSIVIDTNFAKTISLADRLAQPKVTTTRHLPQYFLSDIFTNYIKITTPVDIPKISNVIVIKPGPTPEQGSTTVQQSGFIPNQGSVVIYVPNIDFLIRQGALLSSGVYSSAINVQTPDSVIQITQAQGTQYTNGQFISFIQPSTPNEVEQGSIVIASIIGTPNQGGLEPTQPVGQAAIQTAQGIFIVNGNIESVVQTPTPASDLITNPNTQIQLPSAATQEVPVSIVLATPSLPGSRTNNQSIVLDTLAYLGDRTLAILAPRVKHGSEYPRNAGSTQQGGHLIVDNQSANENTILLSGGGDSIDIGDPAGIKKVGVDNNPNRTETYKQVVKILDSRNNTLNDQQVRDSIKALGTAKGSDLAKYDESFKDVDNPSAENRKNRTVQTINGVANPNVEITKFLGDDDLPTDEASLELLRTKVDIGKQRGNYSNERSSWSSERYYTDITEYNTLEKQVSNLTASPSPTQQSAAKEKVITFTSLRDQQSVSFTAFLTSFEDGFESSFTDYKNVSQQDTFKVFNGVVRNLSIGFKAYALGINEPLFRTSAITATQLVTKLNKLGQIASVGSVGSGFYTIGPYVKISCTGLFKNIICAVSSVKISAQVLDASWDADNNLPTAYEVSISATALADADDKLYNSTSKFLG